MKYCPYCGAGLDEDMHFCPKCGKPFEDGNANPPLSGKSAAEEKAASATLPAMKTDSKLKHRGGIIGLIAAVIIIATVGRSFTSTAFAPKEEPVPTEEPVIPFTDNTDAIAQASQSVVMLTCYDKDGEPYATGSGFAVFDDGVIVTNYHVIEDEVYSVTAQTEGGFSFECPTVLAYDADKDIAILKADRETGLSLLTPGNSTDLQKGEKVVAIGSPLGLINSVSTGVFSGYIKDKAGSVLQFTAAISQGSSGGALFNNAGEVIGITFASLTEGQSLNLAVPIDDVKVLYNNVGRQQAINMEEFYDSSEHVAIIPTYTPSFVCAHAEELKNSQFYVEGWVSSFIYDYESWSPAIISLLEHGYPVDRVGAIYCVDDPSLVFGLTMTGRAFTDSLDISTSVKRAHDNDHNRAKDGTVLHIDIPSSDSDPELLKLKAGTHILVLCNGLEHYESTQTMIHGGSSYYEANYVLFEYVS